MEPLRAGIAIVFLRFSQKSFFILVWILNIQIKIPISLVCLLMRGVEQDVGEEETNFWSTTYNQKNRV